MPYYLKNGLTGENAFEIRFVDFDFGLPSDGEYPFHCAAVGVHFAGGVCCDGSDGQIDRPIITEAHTNASES